MRRRAAVSMAWLVVAALLGCGGVGRAGAQATVPQASISAELQSLAQAARTIFVGQIVAIERRGGVVEVTFRVEQPVLGAPGQTFTLREWAGLWPPNVQRYAVGQRVLAFVHGVGGAGLSSPVHGAEGLVPVVVQGADAPRLLDVRRVAASVVRAPGTRLPDTTDGALPLDAVLGLIASVPTTAGSIPVSLPLPVRGQPPVDLPKASRATHFESEPSGLPGTTSPKSLNGARLLQVRP